MKKLTVVLCILLMLGSMAFAQGSNESTGKSNLRVGMVTDAGTIDDKSFNQGTWEGVKRAGIDYGLDTK